MVKAITGASDDKALLAQAQTVKREIEKSMEQVVAREVKKRYDRFARDWSTAPRFAHELEGARRGLLGFGARELTLKVFPDVQGQGASPEWTFHWTDKGTKRHPITARRAPRLVFRGGYKPKTRFRAQTGGPGISTGKWASPITVDHPGTRAREFSEKLLEDYKRDFLRTLKDATRRAARESRR